MFGNVGSVVKDAGNDPFLIRAREVMTSSVWKIDRNLIFDLALSGYKSKIYTGVFEAQSLSKRGKRRW